jgi:hypothetical protein
MPKSRKSPASILRLGPLLLAGALGGFLAVSAIGWVWHRNRNETLVRENAQVRRQLEMVQKANQQLEFELLGATRPEVLIEQARVLGLVRPDPAQVLHVELTPLGTHPRPRQSAVQLAVRPERP